MYQSRTLLVSIVLSVAAICTSSAQDVDKPVEVRVTARRYAFEPNEIKVTRGASVRLVITAVDGDHGFRLDAFQVKRALRKGETVTVDFAADRSGSFQFQCSHFCGLGHGRMKGTLIVK